MIKYSVVIEGRNFPARVLADAKSPVGFFATRFVEAATPQQAEEIAIEMLKSEYEQLLGAKLADEPMPTLHLDQIKELKEFPEGYANTGTAWFPMDD